MASARFVRSLKLAKPLRLLGLADAGAPSTIPLPKPADGERAAYVEGGALVSFTFAVTGQQKEDVLQSSQLAQRAANKAYDRYNDTYEWYKFYVNVLEKLGWVIQVFEYDNYYEIQRGRSFTISALVLEILDSLVGDDKKLVTLAKETLQALSKTGDDLSLWAFNSTKRDKGSLQIIPCTVGKSNQIVAAFVGLKLEGSALADNYMFVTVKEEDVKISKTAQVFTLDEGVYSQVREAVQSKLGVTSMDDIKRLDLD